MSAPLVKEAMLPALFDHIWQSTLFGAVAGLLTLALRSNRASIRYSLWLAASLKFLVPFSLLVALGGFFGRPAAPAPAAASFPFLVEKVGEPFAGAVSRVTPPLKHAASASLLAETLAAIWAFGFLIVSASWWLRWRKLRAVVRAATPVVLPIGVRARSSGAFWEPGVFGAFRPLLLLPADITSQLTPAQLSAILAHELCHIRRRDNLAAALHRTVEAVFWFYPRVWWIGARLLHERERACDEEVLRLGHEPEAYAEGILKICELSLASRMPCVAGVTGGNLKKRIEDIMHHCGSRRLGFAKQALLITAGTAALAAPMIFGFMNAPAAAQTVSSAAAEAKFEVATIKPCAPGEAPGPAGSSPGRLTLRCMSVMGLINQAYVLYFDGNLHLPGARFVPVEGGPAWIKSDMYSIEAKAEQGFAPEQGVMMGPMLKGLLADRFHLKIRTEFRDIPAYVLTVAKGGPKLQAAQAGSCRALDLLHPPAPPAPGQKVPPPCTRPILQNGEFSVLGATIPEFAAALSSRLDRDIVDRTEIQGVYDIRVALPGVDPMLGLTAPPPPPGASGGPTAPAASPAEPGGFLPVAETVAQKLGLKLESGKGPGRFLVIDQVERPAPN